MENMPDNQTFNPNIEGNPNQGQHTAPNNPQQPYHTYNQPSYTGQYGNNPGYNTGYTQSQGTPYGQPSAYNSPQYTTSTNQQYTTYPHTAAPNQYTQTSQPSPSTIYHNTQTGNAPQYHYGNPMFGGIMNNQYYQEQREKLRKRLENEKKIRKISNVSGFSLMGCYLIATVFSALLLIPAVSDIYYSGLSGQSIINLFYTICVVGGTYFIAGHFIKRIKDKDTLQPKYNIDVRLNGPNDPLKATLLVFISFGGCMLANYVTSIILTFFESFGIYSGYSSIEDPQSVADIILMCIATAIIPPLVEEYAMRGVLMSSLEKYGSVFAIIGSSYIFGLFHGNFAQIPFAFICGLFFGYTVIATDSLWPAIIIHALNNSLSCVSSILIKVFDENTGNMFFYISSISGIVLGVVALIIYIKRYKNDGSLKLKGDAEELPTRTKIAKFLTSPAMIIATIIYLIQAITLLTTTPPTA